TGAPPWRHDRGAVAPQAVRQGRRSPDSRGERRAGCRTAHHQHGDSGGEALRPPARLIASASVDDARDRLAAKLDQILEKYAADGTAVAVALVEHPGAEPLTRTRPHGATEEPRFMIYSVTKTFTAALFLLLQEGGELALDDPLARWSPRALRAERITLRQLLIHTAGVPDYGGLAAYHQAVRETPTQAWTFERYVAETVEKGPLFEPGEGWAYSNPGYMLLRRVAEEATGTPYPRLLAERIAEPLDLHATKVAETIDDLAGL